ncbi:Protein kinase domain-containing protein [Fusarium sp. LHS14.1]|nr:Protein kinase domain-containing protein [Fusarium sp. LHS14.1]
MSRHSATTLSEQLGRLKLHGRDGTGRESSYIPRQSLEAFWEACNINATLRAYAVNKPKDVIFQSFLCTFSLLVYINKVDYLGWLVERNIKDATFPLETRPRSWPDDPPYLELFEAITKSQWIFFPVTFEQYGLYNQIFCPQHIFPICTEELIKAGDIIQVHKIETNPSCAGFGPATYVRKTYNESGKAQYEREVKTFTSLQSRYSPNIINYHGCYQQARPNKTLTYNLIVDFVEGQNLEEFYSTTPPPSPSDANKIWNAFCGVLEGLHQLHSAAIDTGFQTIHQDIKPENLLVSKPTSSQPYDIGLVIIDFGFSHTKTLTTGQDTWGIDLHGGQVYGAPEASHHADYTRLGRTPITPKVDIWSLGCVMSEAAIWIKCGRRGLGNYRQNRVAETRNLPRFDEAGHGGCFHDGAEALNTVRGAHDWIRRTFPGDIVTLQVLEMIEKFMLVPQGDRQDAQMLCERLVKIIQAPSSTNDYSPPPPSSPPARSSSVRSPSVRSPSVRSPSVRSPSVRSPSVRSPSVRSPSVRSPPGRSQSARSPPANSPPRIETRPTSFGYPWTTPTRHQSQNSTTNTTPATPQSPIPTSATGYSLPFSPLVELDGSQPNGAPHPGFFQTPTPAPRRDSPRLLPSSPILTFDQLRDWYNHAKNSSSHVDPRVEDVVRQLGNNVKGRDHIFFVDVSQSMRPYLLEITETFKLMAYLAKRFDPDGVEVCFSSEVPSIHKETTSKLLPRFNEQNWDQISFEDRISTFIDQIVIPRLSSWHQKLKLTKPKNLTIFVLTDGRWGQGRERAAGIENPILRLIKVILKKGLSRTQVAIQFLRFGDDPDGKRYLSFLDDCGKKYNCDCVDTKPIVDGNIFDMFIGPINPDIDKDGEGVL